MVYVTSDLHGCDPDAFRALLDRAGFTEEDYLFVLGDVIDRGEHGAQLLLWLTEQPNVQLILGNHEALLLSCEFLFEEVTEESLSKLNMEQILIMRNWMRNGGAPTLEGLKKILKRDTELFAGIMDYLHDAPLYECVDVGENRYVLVHSGLGNFQPQKLLREYTPHELLWERPTLDTVYYEDMTVIFGHTPTELYGKAHRGRAIVTDSWICIDTGAAMGNSPMVLRLDDRKEFY